MAMVPSPSDHLAKLEERLEKQSAEPVVNGNWMLKQPLRAFRAAAKRSSSKKRGCEALCGCDCSVSREQRSRGRADRTWQVVVGITRADGVKCGGARTIRWWSARQDPEVASRLRRSERGRAADTDGWPQSEQLTDGLTDLPCVQCVRSAASMDRALTQLQSCIAPSPISDSVLFQPLL